MSARYAHWLTFDVEHWYEGYRHRNLGGWDKVPPRDDVVVERLFELLGQYRQTATFFFTGRFAREFPALVRQCAALGHEVASHSDEHRVIYKMAGEEEFRRDLRASLQTLAEITGRAVLGYRAPKWSITEENQHWVLSALAEEGLVYDSSFFPGRGADGARKQGLPLRIEVAGKRSIIEIPASGFNFGGYTAPVGGGLYFRAFPTWVSAAMLAQKERRGTHGMLYVHPYDLDAQSPSIAGGGLLFRIFRSYGVAGAWNKLERLLRDNSFTSIAESLPTLAMVSMLDCRERST